MSNECRALGQTRGNANARARAPRQVRNISILWLGAFLCICCRDLRANWRGLMARRRTPQPPPREWAQVRESAWLGAFSCIAACYLYARLRGPMA